MKINISSQGTLVKVKTEQDKPQKRPNGKRGKVSVFSKASRKRLLQLFATLNAKKYLFLTLTYGDLYPDTDTAKRHLKNFLKRIQYRYPRVCGVWRIEYQDRGAPHYHIVLMNVNFIDKKVIVKLWEEIIGREFSNNTFDKSGERNLTFTRIEAIRKHKKVMSYISKYVAKTEKSGNKNQDTVVSEHKQNFRAGQDAPALAFKERSDANGFNYVTYQHKGRFWGVFGFEFFPFAPKTEVDFNGDFGVYDTFRKHVKGANRWMRVYRVADGLSFFCDCARDWLKLWFKLHSAYLDASPRFDDFEWSV